MYPCPLVLPALARAYIRANIVSASGNLWSALDEAGVDTVVLLANLSLGGLNTLAGHRPPVASDGRCAPQRALQTRAVEKALGMFLRLATVDDVDGYGALLAAIGRAPAGVPGAPPRLVAANCDLLESSAEVDPLDDQPPAVRSLLSDPQLLFPGIAPSTHVARPVPRRDRAEYAALVVRQLASGKVQLAVGCEASCDIFPVGKSNGNLREVWSGGDLSDAAVAPLRPPCLANPTPLLWLEASTTHPLRVYKRDARCYFDQLRTPEGIRPWLGRPAVTVAELLAAGDLTLADVCRQCVGQPRLTPDSVVHPLCCSWPMGFSWSSFLAQTTLLGCCTRAGLGPSSLLTLDQPIPFDLRVTAALATDDVAIFTSRPRSVSDDVVARLDAEILRRGIQPHPGKDVNYALDATVIGVDLVAGILFLPPTQQARKVAGRHCSSLETWPPHHRGRVRGIERADGVVGSP